MKRKEFLRKGLTSIAGLTAVGAMANQSEKSIVDVVGFNHLPLESSTSGNTVLHKAQSRGHANHGWLDSHHSFSFANYYNPERMNFGALRVLNDDIVSAGRGFRTHPHENMEIISIPISGDLKHKDSMGNEQIIRQGDVQVMSAGKGIFHSEFNRSDVENVQFLQIWLFPNRKDVQPRYDQISLDIERRKNRWDQILSPSMHDDGVWIHQNAWFHMTDLETDKSLNYDLKIPKNGVYLFVISGEVEVEGHTLMQRDAFGIWDVDFISLKSKSKAELLLIEVPMA
ncbi:MAG: pirin family protein [Cyclobacteriaceae bacterium]